MDALANGLYSGRNFHFPGAPQLWNGIAKEIVTTSIWDFTTDVASAYTRRDTISCKQNPLLLL
jgi:hypothetical protein